MKPTKEFIPVFKRYEKKYLLSPAQYAGLQQVFSKEMEADGRGLHTVSSIYFDTPDFQMIRQSLEKPVFKEKIRIRCYGEPAAKKPLFFELKKKYKGIVYKRRVAMLPRELTAYLMNQSVPAAASGQIMNEINYAMTYYRPEPKVLIAYDRLAYAGKADSELRITFDHEIRFRDQDLDFASGSYGLPLLKKGEVLMEVKTTRAMPRWLVDALNELQILPSSFSKYGNCYQRFLASQALKFPSFKHLQTYEKELSIQHEKAFN